jgi:hypothetical protein
MRVYLAGNKKDLNIEFDQARLWRGAAGYVDQLLKGAKLEGLPIQLPTSFVLDINLADG